MVVDCRRSDRQKLAAPSVRNYDRVIPPSHIALPQSQQSSGAAKIRPGRRDNRRPSSKEVFDLGIHPPQPDAVEMSPSPPNGSPEPSPVDVLTPFPTGSFAAAAANSDERRDGRTAPAKHSTKKDDRSNPARRLRGRPPELPRSYFDNEATDSRRAAKNDPFWEAPPPEAHSTPRRPSIEQQSTSLFKPPTYEEDVEPTTEVVNDVGMSVV